MFIIYCQLQVSKKFSSLFTQDLITYLVELYI